MTVLNCIRQNKICVLATNNCDCGVGQFYQPEVGANVPTCWLELKHTCQGIARDSDTRISECTYSNCNKSVYHILDAYEFIGQWIKL